MKTLFGLIWVRCPFLNQSLEPGRWKALIDQAWVTCLPTWWRGRMVGVMVKGYLGDCILGGCPHMAYITRSGLWEDPQRKINVQ